jgi:trehalose utilization protein
MVEEVITEELVKKYVDAIMTFREVVHEITNKLKEQDSIPFCQAVIKEMRGRGVSEDLIANTVKGMIWGQANWSAIEQEIESTPNILDAIENLDGQTGSAKED